MEPVALTQPPFDRPQSFVRMFTTEQQMSLVAIISRIKSNAENPAA
jgi:type I restriction enzyme R subunit